MGRPARQKRLNPVQMEMVTLLWDGLSMKEIAPRLGLTYHQAVYLRKRIGEKLNTRTQWKLARYVVEQGLVSVNKVSA